MACIYPVYRAVKVEPQYLENGTPVSPGLRYLVVTKRERKGKWMPCCNDSGALLFESRQLALAEIARVKEDDAQPMKLRIEYPTKEREYISQTAYRNVYKAAELEVVRVVRYPCGRGAAANRYHYSAHFKAPDDALFSFDGLLQANINRKANPHFNPKNLNFVGDVWSACRPVERN